LRDFYDIIGFRGKFHGRLIVRICGIRLTGSRIMWVSTRGAFSLTFSAPLNYSGKTISRMRNRFRSARQVRISNFPVSLCRGGLGLRPPPGGGVEKLDIFVCPSCFSTVKFMLTTSQ